VITNLLLTGGYLHPFEDTAPRLAEVLSGAGVVSDVCFDLEAGLAHLTGYDLVTVYALRWTMARPMFDSERDAWAQSLSSAARSGLIAHVERGGGVLAVHTAAICFDDWPEWRALVGAAWNWDRSFHPPPRTMRVDVGGGHPITAGLGGFELEDECYTNLDWDPGMQVLASAPYRGVQPLIGARNREGRRVVSDALGHDLRSLSHPTHQTLLRRAALWASGRPDDEVAATP
jgi:type 1 glutamine amidotransferase